MNNNRGNNNRRRGRGSNNSNRQGGGGQQLNRVDSRARGNAPQLLEKYRKLAHDAHLNGDRVTEEYYLQFADHYFRVLADSRQRPDEQRPRRDDRWQEGGDPYREEGEDGGEYGADGESQPYGEAPAFTRRDRDDRPREERPRDDRPRDDRPREERPRREARTPRTEEEPRAADEAEAAEPDDRSPAIEPPVNPFTRDTRSRGLKPRREDRRPRRAEASDEPAGLDPASLPPSISTGREESVENPALAAETAPAEEEAPKPRRRTTRRPRATSGDADESLEAIG